MASVSPPELLRASGSDGLDLLLQDVDKLVSMPDIYYRLEELVVSPAATPDDLALLFRSDPDLCARMLRIANSAFYSFPTRIETIERAIVTIGLRQIRELVLMTSVVAAFDGLAEHNVDMEIFWEHSVAVAVTARAVGRSRAIPNADSFYIPGLLHDIGRLVMYLKLPGLTGELLQRRAQSGEAMVTLELEMLGYSHADIGAALLQKWKVPATICEPVRYHHDPQAAGESILSASAVHIADVWVNQVGNGGNSADYWSQFVPAALAMITVEPETLDSIGSGAVQQTGAIVSQFSLH